MIVMFCLLYLLFWKCWHKIQYHLNENHAQCLMHLTLMHPAGTSVSSVNCDKPVHSASHYGQWGQFFLACGQTNSLENP